MDWFHSFNCSLLLGVLLFVFLRMFFLVFSSYFYKIKKIEYQLGELVCSLIPVGILLIQIFPSLSLLFYYGLINLSRDLSVKVVGNQWFWNYEYRNLNISFDSYIKSLDLIELGDLRTLEVDNRCVLPVNTNLRFCITSSDVIHAWALSRLRVKLDAIRGILSILNYNFSLIGLFYGQCREICGANHRFIPVVLEVVLFDFFKDWVLRI
jgi:heme/copper-type cytochrome/quinol oxidase subunit 2